MIFSLVTYLIKEDYKLVREIQKEISEITGSKKCLIDWLPHITVGDAIIINENKLPSILQELQELANQQKMINAKINGFGNVNDWKGAVAGKVTPYVIWLNVEINHELVDLFNRLRDNITSGYETYLPRTFNYAPHITIAFFDLDVEGYKKGLDYLRNKSFEREFEISHVSLVECYGEVNMTSAEYMRYYFNLSSIPQEYKHS